MPPLRSMLRWVSHPQVALVVGAWVFLYLAAVSVAGPVWLVERLGWLGSPYVHPLLMVPVMVGCVNMAAASLVRVAWDLPRLGAHLAHAGVLVLVASSCWYSVLREHGQAVTQRTPNGWTPVTRYLSDTVMAEAIRAGRTEMPPDAIRPLGGSLQVLTARRIDQPGSAMPADYRCEVELTGPAGRRRAVLALNRPVRVGRFQVALGQWLDDGIILQVTTRPGLAAVWVGLGLIVGGMLWAFYVKPLLAGRGRRLS